jgi:hypothetical protein
MYLLDFFLDLREKIIRAIALPVHFRSGRG